MVMLGDIPTMEPASTMIDSPGSRWNFAIAKDGLNSSSCCMRPSGFQRFLNPVEPIPAPESKRNRRQVSGARCLGGPGRLESRAATGVGMRSLSWIAAFVIVGVCVSGAARGEWVDLSGSRAGGGSVGPGSGARIQVEQAADGGRLVVRVRLDGFRREGTEGSRFERIEMGAATLREGGRPALPVVAVPLLVDGEAEVVAVRGEWTAFDGIVPEPFSLRPKRCGGGKWRVSCDEELYAGDEPFPSQMVVAVQRGAMRGNGVLLLEVRPFRYLPSKRRLEVAKVLEVEVAGRLAGRTPERMGSGEFARMAKSGFYSALGGDKSEVEGRDGDGPEVMLAIVHDSLLSAMPDFVAWKRQRGIEVTVQPLSAVGASYQGVQKAIADAYAGWERAPTWVLLVGDGEGAGKVPFVPSPYGCASDFLYSTLDGNDLYSDVLVGRVSAP
ncbi:MAG: hypothetical protein FJ109_10500, partial [Deltaproteobacteria bacterium]|nr:hypothetical protein [Deltaproteobacteria bacterium]